MQIYKNPLAELSLGGTWYCQSANEANCPSRWLTDAINVLNLDVRNRGREQMGNTNCHIQVSQVLNYRNLS